MSASALPTGTEGSVYLLPVPHVVEQEQSFLLGEYLRFALAHASRTDEIAGWLTVHQEVIRHLMQHRFPRGEQARAAVDATAVASWSVAILRQTVDDLYTPDDLSSTHDLLLRRSQPAVRSERGLRWMICHLAWFQGRSRKTVARRLSVSQETVRRRLELLEKEVIELWLAHFAYYLQSNCGCFAQPPAVKLWVAGG